MPNPFNLSSERLKELAQLCGGLAVLALAAVFLVHTISPTTETRLAAAVATSDVTSGDVTLHLQANPSEPASGGYAQVKWTVTDDGAVSTPVLNNAVTGMFSSTNSTSFDYNAGSGTGRVLVIVVGIDDSSRHINSITYGGVSMTQSNYVTTSATVSTQVFYLVNPASGTNTVSITASGSDYYSYVVSYASGVNTASPIGTASTKTGRSSTPNVDITPQEAGSLLVAGLVDDSTGTMSASGGSTLVGQVSNRVRTGLATKVAAGTSSHNVAVSGSNDDWTSAALELKGTSLYTPSCTVSDSSGTLGTGMSGSEVVGPLSSDEEFTLSCTGTSAGSVETSVNVTLSASGGGGAEVTIDATDDTATEAGDTGTFTLTRTGSLGSSYSTCGSGSNIAFTDMGNGQCRAYITAGTSFTVPDDWDSASNTVEVIGAGGAGGGDEYSGDVGSGGGGGAYAKVSNLAFTSGDTVTYQVGAGGAGEYANPGNDGGDTYFDGTGTTCSSQSVCAKGGTGGQDYGGSGGKGGEQSGNTGSIGDVVYAGGNGAQTDGYDGGGGGGAGGLNGAGSNGSVPTGGDADNGTVAGGAMTTDGNNGTEWDSSQGSGSGAGGVAHGDDENGHDGGLYGGGGGGAWAQFDDRAGGDGSQGLIVVTYTSTGEGGPASTICNAGGSNVAFVSIGGGLCRGYITSGTSFTVPTDWDISSNTVEVIGGAGAGGGDNGDSAGAGGGGGAYAAVENLFLVPGDTVTYQVGAGGVGQFNKDGLDGSDTYFDGTGTTCSSQSVCAKGGTGGERYEGNPGSGGEQSGNTGSIGDTIYAGGNGAPVYSPSYWLEGGGGGGAGGPHGAGSSAVTSAGAAADNGNTPGVDSQTDGNNGTQWDSSHGSGSGAGGNSLLDGEGAEGGLYGGGGAGAYADNNYVKGGDGGQGIIVITFAPISYSAYPELNVAYTISTGTGEATNGTDYETISGSVTFAEGENTAEITITPLQDLIYEGDETVTLTVDDSGGSYTAGTPSSDSVTIADDETASSLPSGSFSSCVDTADASCELGVTPNFVRSGSSVDITWYVEGLITGENGHTGNICTITRTPDDATFPITSTGDSATWIDSTGVSDVITEPTIFTLSCESEGGATTQPVSQKVNVIPSFQEI